MKIDRKKISYLIFFATCASITTYTFFIISSINKKSETNTAVKKNFLIDEKKDHKYLIKGDNDKIEIFKKGTETPLYTIRKEIANFPEYDQKMLQDGIYAYSDEQLYKIIEDYEDWFLSILLI